MINNSLPMELNSSTSAACAAANFCKAFNPEAPDCGTDPEHLSPLPVAKEMCVRALTGAIDNRSGVASDDHDSPYYRTKQLAQSAWAYFEAGVAEKDKARATEYLDASKKCADSLIRGGYSEFRTVYSAA